MQASVVSAELPFVSLTIQPAYRSGSCVITWRRSAAYKQHGVLIYRSLDGVGDWELVNPDDEPIVAIEQFIDQDLPTDSRLDQVYYKFALEDQDDDNAPIVMADTIGLREFTTQKDYTTARRFMVAELERLRQAGTPAFMFLPRRRGVATGVDARTMKVADYCDYKKAGSTGRGFGEPIQTWVQLLGATHSRKVPTDGTAADETVETGARIPGFPEPVPGTLIVLPGTDDRYVVGPQLTPLSFRGLIPIGHTVTLARLSRQDPRYNVPVPRLDPNLLFPSQRA